MPSATGMCMAWRRRVLQQSPSATSIMDRVDHYQCGIHRDHPRRDFLRHMDKTTCHHQHCHRVLCPRCRHAIHRIHYRPTRVHESFCHLHHWRTPPHRRRVVDRKMATETHPNNDVYVRLGILIGGLAVILAGMLLYLGLPLLTGKTIILATQPVDPFDPIRGQYFTIRYEINTVPKIDGVNSGDTIYVTVAPDSGGIYRYQSTSIEQPSTGVFLRGAVQDTTGTTMRVRYGIEQFFTERGATLPSGNLTVAVKITSRGVARIDTLLTNGQPSRLVYRSPVSK
jgi:uncharacterized membrane-anchored protein